MSWFETGRDTAYTTAILVEARQMRDEAIRQILSNACRALSGVARRSLQAIRLPHHGPHGATN
jgi:hypothetical protein